MKNTYASWLDQAQAQLSSISDTARLDSQLLLAFVLQKEVSHLLAWPEKTISDSDLLALDTLFKRRLTGEPMAYILEQAEFWGLTLYVNSDVLVPRADTEVIVEAVLNVVKDNDLTTPDILDMGTGSGAIALALAHELQDAKVTGLDISDKALAVARHNEKQNNIHNINWLKSDWFADISSQQFDIIISNPPYVAQDDPHLDSLTHEPDVALTADDDGFADLALIIKQAPEYLCDGWLFLEHGFNQANKVRELMMAEGFQDVVSVRDLARHERCTFGKINRYG